MLRKIAAVVVFVPLGILIIAFAVANRHTVTVSFDPFSANEPATAVMLPLFGLVIGLLILGVVVGGVATWLGQGRWRRAARQLQRDLADLRGELDGLRRNAEPSIIPDRASAPPRLKLKPPAG